MALLNTLMIIIFFFFLIFYNLLINKQMGVSETSINRKKVNYVARKRTKERQRKSGKPQLTIDSKKARQIKLFERK